MEKEINLVELLKNCPRGMELNCTMFERVEFDGIVDNEQLPIRCRIKNPDGGYNVYNFTKHGNWIDTAFAKCVIFPKGKTTWEGFVPPCKFKDGDVIHVDCGVGYKYIAIFKQIKINDTVCVYCVYDISNNKFYIHENLCEASEAEIRFATEKEKQEFFQVIKNNDYKWNAETKILEKLPKFKVGNRVRKNKDYISGIVTNISDDDYKVEYQGGGVSYVSLAYQDEWELVSNKFDINTLKPFESKVLVRDSEAEKWKPAIWGYYDSDETYDYPYEVVGGIGFSMCIPYEENKHLRGKTDDCSSFYKTWE